METILKKYKNRLSILTENKKNAVVGDNYPYDFEIKCVIEFIKDLEKIKAFKKEID
jgi:hypothetical protein